MDSVAYAAKHGRAYDILLMAERCWESLDKFRRDRERCLRYTYGDQWGDKIIRNNECISEKDAIVRSGNVPLTNNLIRRLVRTVVGVYRNQNKIPSCTANDRDEQGLGDVMSVTLQANWKLNRKSELDARGFEEYLISGFAMQKETWGWRNGKFDCWTYQPNPNYIFFDTNSIDVRGWDLSCIGQLHDLTFNQLCSYFAHSPEDYASLQEIYQHCNDPKWFASFNERERKGHDYSTNFLFPYDPSMCRVIEVWTSETKPRYRCHDYLTGDIYKIDVEDKPVYDIINRERIKQYAEQGISEDDVPLIDMEWFMDDYWYYRYLSPTGDVLDEGETPFDHGSHPFSLKCYPFTNGEIHSFVYDVLDVQRYVNRLLSLNDKLIRSSAKGLLLFPVSMIPEGMTREQVLSTWTDPEGVMFYDDIANRVSGAKPEQIANRLNNPGIDNLLQTEIGLMEEITGVNGALQGKPGFSGMSASLYQQQTMNATASISDLLDSYDDFIIEGAVKKVKNMQQFYDRKKTVSIAGKRGTIQYDPATCGDVDCDLSITESNETPAFRNVSNDLLMKLLELGAITVEQFLEYSSFPFSDGLLESIKADKQAAVQQQGAAPMQPQQQQPQMQTA